MEPIRPLNPPPRLPAESIGKRLLAAARTAAAMHMATTAEHMLREGPRSPAFDYPAPAAGGAR